MKKRSNFANHRGVAIALTEIPSLINCARWRRRDREERMEDGRGFMTVACCDYDLPGLVIKESRPPAFFLW